MLTNVEGVEAFASLARARARNYETRTVSPAAAAEHLESGWEVAKKNKKSVRLSRPKSHGVLLEDRVWTLLYRMKFLYLSGRGGAQLRLDSGEDSPQSQIDVAAIDDEVAIAIECKSTEKTARLAQFQQELGKHSLIRERFTQSARKLFEPQGKRLVVLAMLDRKSVV